jgi:hypothetical protein
MMNSVFKAESGDVWEALVLLAIYLRRLAHEHNEFVRPMADPSVECTVVRCSEDIDTLWAQKRGS